MRVGRHIDGRQLTYDEHSGQFAIGGEPTTLETVLQYDARAQIEWPNDDMRDWARALPARMEEGVHAKRGKLLGFRSRSPGNMAVASAYYLSIAVVALGAVTQDRPPGGDARDTAIQVAGGLLLVLLMLLPAIVWSDYEYKRRLPFLRDRGGRVLALVACAVVLLTALGAIDSMHSQAFQAARDAEHEPQFTATTPPEEAKVATAPPKKATKPPTQNPQSRAQAQKAYDLGEMTNPQLVNNFTAACGLIGVDLSKVKKMTRLPDWASGERYSFMYGSSELRAFANADQTISSINVGDIRVYEQGFAPLKVDDYLVDLATALELTVCAERTVKEALNYPKTADFSRSDWGVGRSRDIYSIGGRFSAENALRIAEGTSYYIEYRKKGESCSLKYFRLGNEVMIGDKSVITTPTRKETATASGKSKIQLVDGTLGTYGRAKTIDGDKYIWYYVPPGEYEVTSQTNMTKLYLDKNKTITNSDGYSECVRVRTLDFDKVGQSKLLTVSKEQHVELTMRAKVTLIPAR